MVKTTIYISKEMREALGKMKVNSRETYDMLLRRKLMTNKTKKLIKEVSKEIR